MIKIIGHSATVVSLSTYSNGFSSEAVGPIIFIVSNITSIGRGNEQVFGQIRTLFAMPT